MAELFRFRCFRCQKLLGAPPSKFGKTILCPRCTAEIVVPTPGADEVEADEPGEEHAFALNLDDLGSGLRPLPGRRPGPSSSLRDPGFDVGGANPVAFLESVPAPAAEPAPLDPESGPAEEDDAEVEAVAVDLAPRVSPVTGRKPVAASVMTSELTNRRRDVVLPRTVVLAWTLGALLGTGSAFLAGLMIGHYVW